MSKLFEEEDFSESRKEHKTARKRASKKDRSKYKKTDSEKKERHDKLATEKKLSKNQNLLRGRVLAITPDGISVQYEDNVYLCTLRGALKKEINRAKNLVTVGDFVLFEEGSIAHVEERVSVLSRQDNLRRRQMQLIAANIDQVLITVSVVQPHLKPHLIDRYIIATYKGKMEPVIVINKVDLLEKASEEAELLTHCLETYRALGIPILPISAETGEGIEQLKEQMQGRASVFSGQSGVGKSSLINTMTGLDLAVAEVVKKTRKGTHTTSSTHLIPLSFGGWCIDTPGIRSFGVWDLKKEDVESYFPEIQKESRHCRFPNCSHTHEPGCALEEALQSGKISALRFDSYLKLLKELK